MKIFKKNYILLLIIFFLLFVLLVDYFFFLKKKDNNKNQTLVKEGVSVVNLKKDFENLQEKKLLKEGKIKILKLDLSNIVNLNDSLNKKNIQTKILADKNNKIDEEVSKINNIKEQYGNYLYNQFLSKIKVFNKKNKEVKIVFNSFLVKKYKSDIINAIILYLKNLDGNYSIDTYLEKNKISFLLFLLNVNNVLKDKLKKDLFKVDFNFGLVKHLTWKKYYNGYGLGKDYVLSEIINSEIKNIKNDLNEKYKNDKQIKINDDFVYGYLIKKYSKYLNNNFYKIKTNEKEYYSLFLISFLLYYYGKKYSKIIEKNNLGYDNFYILLLRDIEKRIKEIGKNEGNDILNLILFK